MANFLSGHFLIFQNISYMIGRNTQEVEK